MSQVHPRARTTPLIRAEIRASKRGVVKLAERYSISRTTAAKWKRLHKAAPMKITKLLTDNGSPFMDRFTRKVQESSGLHHFDVHCKTLSIEHRLARPAIRRPTAWSSASMDALPIS